MGQVAVLPLIYVFILKTYSSCQGYDEKKASGLNLIRKLDLGYSRFRGDTSAMDKVTPRAMDEVGR